MIRRSIPLLLLLGILSGSLRTGAQNVVVAPVPPPQPPPRVEASPQDQTEPPPGTASKPAGPAAYSISGIVVSATNGAPLDRAEVSLSTPGPRGASIATATTAENGGFRFDHLQAGRYRLRASRRGYISAGYQEHEGFFTGVVTGPNLGSSGLRVKLFPTAIVGGVITDDAGEPVAGAQVHLYRQDESSGEMKVVSAGQDDSDDTGSWEFSHLRAGTYYVAVSATPWYAFRPEPRRDSSGNALPADQQPRSPLDVAYATTFYENAPDSDSAAPIQVNAGDHEEINFSLHAVPALHIQIRMAGAGEGRGVPMPQVMQPAFSGEFYPQTTWRSTSDSGGPTVVELNGLAPGNYVLRESREAGEGNRAVSVDFTADQSLDLSAAVGGVDVSGKVTMLSGDPLPARTNVVLAPAGNGVSVNTPTRVEADGRFDFRFVAPGSYDFQVHAPGSSLSVAQIATSGGEAHGSRITVGSEAVLIAATVASGTTTINGYARQNGQPLGGAMILLVPRDPSASQDLDRRDQSNTDGSFTLNHVIPGSYTLVAIEDGWTLEWAKPEAIAPYLAHGIRIQVTGQKTMNLPSAVEVQTR